MDVSEVSSAQVADHLKKYGLETKAAEPLNGGLLLV